MQDHRPEIRRLFIEGFARESSDRDPFLAEAPAGPVLDELRSQLARTGAEATFLDTATASSFPAFTPAAENLIGATLGPWRIVGRIGAGGMGVVYRAVRADAAFEREVALKVIGTLGQSPRGIERFRLERETLARLDDPAIARLLDGGTTPGGSPYFVMELIDGVPVDRYCDEHQLSIGRRLEVFFRICRGVEYAHRSLVVHRDLKPDNILVLADGSPKLLDFGVAKLQGGPGLSADIDAAAAASTWALTPDFASPEQMSGGLVTTASDVYSLGVLLHLLLTGLLPYRLGQETRHTMTATLATMHVATPSSRVGEGDSEARASLRRLTPRTLAERLQGDLDAIILRALARDPAERYQTVDALVLDLRRHRQMLPVNARPRTAAYVAGCFFQRHHVSLMIGLALLVVLGVGIRAIVKQAAVAREAQAGAERRFSDLRSITRVFTSDVDDAIRNVPGTTDARVLILRTGMEHLERLSAENSPDPSLRRELAAGLVKLGDAQGNPSQPNIGDVSAARDSYLRAIRIASGLTAADASNVEASRTLSMAHRGLGDVLAWMGDRTRALTHAEASAAQFSRLAALPGATSEDRLQAAIAQIELGDLLGNPNLPNLGRAEAALARYEAARATLRPLLARVPGDRQLRRYVGVVHERIGTIHQLARRWPQAAAAYRESFAIREALAASTPEHFDVQRDLASAYDRLADVERQAGRVAAAVTYSRSALAGFEQLASRDQVNAYATRSVAVSREHLGDMLLELGQRGAALATLRAALVGHRELADRDAGNAQAFCDAARVGDRVGDLLGHGVPTAAACTAWRDADRMRRRVVANACGAADDVSRASRTRLERCAPLAAGAP